MGRGRGGDRCGRHGCRGGALATLIADAAARKRRDGRRSRSRPPDPAGPVGPARAVRARRPSGRCRPGLAQARFGCGLCHRPYGPFPRRFRPERLRRRGPAARGGRSPRVDGADVVPRGRPGGADGARELAHAAGGRRSRFGSGAGDVAVRPRGGAARHAVSGCGGDADRYRRAVETSDRRRARRRLRRLRPVRIHCGAARGDLPRAAGRPPRSVDGVCRRAGPDQHRMPEPSRRGRRRPRGLRAGGAVGARDRNFDGTERRSQRSDQV